MPIAYIVKQWRQCFNAFVRILSQVHEGGKVENAHFLTVEQVAQRLLVQPAAVRTWLKRGQLRGFKLPGPLGEWRIRTEDVETMLAAPVKVADAVEA